ncbi:hypothetical protein K1X76_06530 [bacterium]|nr:hypothetical protein [bacterium]
MRKILLSFIVIMLVSAKVHAITITVDLSNDEFEADYASDCTAGVDCSFTEALKLANDTPDLDTIQIADTVGPIQILANTNYRIVAPVRIVGSGNAKTVIDGTSATDQPFTVYTQAFLSGASKYVQFKNIEFKNFTHIHSWESAIISFQGVGRLELDTVSMINNASDYYGPVQLSGADSLLTISNSEFINNTNRLSTGGVILSDQGTVTIVSSTFDGNTSGGNGGSIYVSRGALVAIDTVFSNNHAGSPVPRAHSGGAVFLNLSHGAFTKTKFINNEAKSYGAGLAVIEETACPLSFCPTPLNINISIQNSVFSDNNAVLGAGIYLKDAVSDDHNIHASIINSNIINNFGRSQTVPAVVPGQGAGIYANNVDLRISYSTVANNTASYQGNFVPGGGIQIVGNKEVGIKASIISGNTSFILQTVDGEIQAQTVASDCLIQSTNAYSAGYNVWGSTCNLINSTPNADATVESAGFGPALLENGFAVALPLTNDSPAVDFAESTAKHCESLPDFTTLSVVSVPTDSLDTARPVGTYCDAGAYELNCSSLAAYYRDVDGDSYGTGTPVLLCSPRAGYTVREGDCNDADSFAYTSVADESCDGHDNNCNGEVDENFPDSDGNGIKDCLDVERCDGVDNDGNGEVDEGFSDIDGDGIKDCADVETCDGLDNDGDGSVDEGFADADGDGIANCMDRETCDGIDNNGNGQTDEGFGDVDHDGIADCVDTEECDGFDNNNSGQIDEGFPDADGDQIADCVDVEICDGLDNNGDGNVDEGFDANGNGILDCLEIPQELCNGIDDDGDGQIDEDFGDNDGDGIANCRDVETCDGIDNDGNGIVDDGFADSDLDGIANCQDTETCDGIDNDGNGIVDEGFDVNGNGIADCAEIPVTPVEVCNGLDDDGDGQVDEGFADTDADGIADCRDAETCDGIDNNGDGLLDEGFDDSDGDGIADCVDIEECDDFDNNGDGLINEGLDCSTPTVETPASETPASETPVDDPADTGNTPVAGGKSSGGGCSMNQQANFQSCAGAVLLLAYLGLYYVKRKRLSQMI